MYIRRLIGTSAVLLLLSIAIMGAVRSDIADAVMKGDKAAVRMLIQQHTDVNAPQADGATAIHWAVYRDDLDMSELLIRAGANVKTRNREGMTPLLLACINGNAAIIDKLMTAGADPNESLSNGETALMMAARTGKVDAIKVLLDRGADLNAKETLRGTTALMWAAAQRHPAAVKLLADRGADVSVRSKAAPLGRGPYLELTQAERLAVLQRKQGQGQTPDQAPDQNAQAGQAAAAPARARDQVQNQDQAGGLTALVFAARQNDFESARILLAAGADVNEVTQYGWSPLLTATKNGYYKLALFLLDNGANPNLANKGGWTPLYLATDNRNIEAGDYPTRKSDIDDLEFIKILLDRGADPNARMKDSTETRTIFTQQWLHEEGATAFLRAGQSGDITLMRLLLAHGADPLIATANNDTPLMVAAGIGWVEGVTTERSPSENLEAVKLLIELGNDVNATNDDGRTALHGAAHKGRNPVVQVLVDKGAKLDAKDTYSRDTAGGLLQGITFMALDYAEGLVRVGVQSAIAHPETAALLRKLMADAGLPLPPVNHDAKSICVTNACR